MGRSGHGGLRIGERKGGELIGGRLLGGNVAEDVHGLVDLRLERVGRLQQMKNLRLVHLQQHSRHFRRCFRLQLLHQRVQGLSQHLLHHHKSPCQFCHFLSLLSLTRYVKKASTLLSIEETDTSTYFPLLSPALSLSISLSQDDSIKQWFSLSDRRHTTQHYPTIFSLDKNRAELHPHDIALSLSYPHFFLTLNSSTLPQLIPFADFNPKISLIRYLSLWV